MTCKKATEWSFGTTGLITKETTMQAKSTAKVSTTGQTDRSTTGNGQKMKCMERATSNGQTAGTTGAASRWA